jgi:hypothetical protein
MLKNKVIMAKKLIDYHKEWVEDGKMSRTGLCSCFSNITELYKYEEFFFLFETNDIGYWAAPEIKTECKRPFIYTPTRQHIVLFICAMCGEI